MYDVKNLSIWKESSQGRIRTSSDYMEDLADLALTPRSYNCLRRAGCETIGDVLKLYDGSEENLSRIRNLGKKSIAEIVEKLQDYVERNQYAALSMVKKVTTINGADRGKDLMISYGQGQIRYEDLMAGRVIIPRRHTMEQIRPADAMLDRRIESYQISHKAADSLHACGIHIVRDLYATDPKNEPGWYAVRELFRRMAEE